MSATQLQLIDATCKVEQAQAVLSMWLESLPADTPQELPRMIGCILSLLGDVPEVMAEADAELAQRTVNPSVVRAIR
jgi:hypothetical protein